MSRKYCSLLYDCQRDRNLGWRAGQ